MRGDVEVSTYPYPLPTVQQPQRPNCWGLSYDNDSHECTKRCGYNQSCKEKVQHSMMQTPQFYRPQQPPPPVQQQQIPYYQPGQYNYPPAQPYPIPYQPAQMAPIRPGPPAPVAFAQQPYQPPQVPPQMPQQQGVIGHYGAFQDPMFHQLSVAPAPYRPQQPGESFIERLVKNVLLNVLEEALHQCVLGVRQAVLYPATQERQMVDITPKK